MSAENSTSTALVVVDMQQNVLHDLRKRSPSEVARVIANVRAAMDSARASAQMLLVQVLHVPLLAAAPNLHREVSPRSATWKFVEQFNDRAVAEEYDALPETAPQEGDMVFSKPGYDPFKPFVLGPYLHDRSIERLVFAGVRADWCITIAVRHALRNFPEVALIGDATMAGEKSTEAVLAELQRDGAEILTTAQFQAKC
jgi:nicotinamidase-related amidase